MSVLKNISLFFVVIILTACTQHRLLNSAIPTTIPAEHQVAHPIRIAVVLGGGGVRGFAHLGVLKAFEENHIPIDLLVGTSAGSIVGSLYADDPNSSKLITQLLLAKKSDLMDLRLFGKTGGLDDGYTMQKYLLDHLHAKDFKDLKIKFIAVATDLNTGRPVAISSGPIPPAVNASSALPPVFRPVDLYGYTLADGGASDVVPVNIAKRYHPQLIIAINVVQNPGDTIKKHSMFEVEKRYGLLRMKNFADYQAQLADVVINPEVGMSGTFDFSKRPELVKAGEEATLRAIPQIKALMKKKNIAPTR